MEPLARGARRVRRDPRPPLRRGRPEDADLAWAGADDELEELRRKALYWLERAADLAVRRYEIDDGVTLYHRALELTDDRRVQTRIWHALGRAYAFKFDGLRFWDAMQKAIDLCDDATLRGDLYADLALHTAGRIDVARPTRVGNPPWLDRPRSRARACRLCVEGEGVRRTVDVGQGTR